MENGSQQDPHGPGDDDDDDDDFDEGWTREVFAYSDYFDKIVAVQLRFAAVCVDNFGETIEVPCHYGSEKLVAMGIPKVPVDDKGNVAALPVLCGRLLPATGGIHLTLQMSTRTGGPVIEAQIDPADIALMWVVRTPAALEKRESPIIMPSGNHGRN